MGGVWPTLFVTVPLAVGLSVLAAWLFYQAVERHFLNAPSLVIRGTAPLRRLIISPQRI